MGSAVRGLNTRQLEMQPHRARPTSNVPCTCCRTQLAYSRFFEGRTQVQIFSSRLTDAVVQAVTFCRCALPVEPSEDEGAAFARFRDTLVHLASLLHGVGLATLRSDLDMDNLCVRPCPLESLDLALRNADAGKSIRLICARAQSDCCFATTTSCACARGCRVRVASGAQRAKRAGGCRCTTRSTLRRPRGPTAAFAAKRLWKTRQMPTPCRQTDARLARILPAIQTARLTATRSRSREPSRRMLTTCLCWTSSCSVRPPLMHRRQMQPIVLSA
jgi:hypothetical protein